MPKLEVKTIASAAALFKDYVVPRKPALFAAHSPDLAHLRSLWTDDYLISTAGGAVLQVEQRSSDAEGYGKGHKIPLTLMETLQRLADGDTSLYLTTQEVPNERDGHPALYGSPVAELAADIPLLPQVMGSLVPQSINIWLGAAQDGSSTGLHTDFHDNLYVLLRGRKRFRLYPPELAKRMYTVGKVEKVYPNGRIVFKGQGAIQADGSDAGEVQQWLRRRKAEQELAAAEQAVEQGVPGAAKRLRAAERLLDAVLEASLGDDWDGVDDFDALEPAAVPPPVPAGAVPVSFSQADLQLPDEQLQRSFPRFPGKAAALVCELEAGQMLYLPAGWFHEVTSYSTEESSTHMALNFWYHPPTAPSFEQPYSSEYWPTVWEGRRAQYEARHRCTPGSHQQQSGQRQQESGAVQQKTLNGGQLEDVKEQQQRARRQQQRQRQAAAPLPGSYGLFGIGRRQHLHRFVTGKRKA